MTQLPERDQVDRFPQLSCR